MLLQTTMNTGGVDAAQLASASLLPLAIGLRNCCRGCAEPLEVRREASARRSTASVLSAFAGERFADAEPEVAIGGLFAHQRFEGLDLAEEQLVLAVRVGPVLQEFAGDLCDALVIAFAQSLTRSRTRFTWSLG